MIRTAMAPDEPSNLFPLIFSHDMNTGGVNFSADAPNTTGNWGPTMAVSPGEHVECGVGMGGEENYEPSGRNAVEETFAAKQVASKQSEEMYSAEQLRAMQNRIKGLERYCSQLERHVKRINEYWMKEWASRMWSEQIALDIARSVANTTQDDDQSPSGQNTGESYLHSGQHFDGQEHVDPFGEDGMQALPDVPSADYMLPVSSPRTVLSGNKAF